MRPFEILEPGSLEEAASKLAEWGPEASIYAGGTEILLLMKEGLVHYPKLIDVKKIPGMAEIEVVEDTLRIGALVTHRKLERDSLITERAPLLSEVEAMVGNVRVRTAGTIGGNLCFGEPHSDPATLLTAWGGEVELISAKGDRQLPVGDFIVGLFETARREDEILSRVEIPLLKPGTGGGYRKAGFHERPTATVAAIVRLQEGEIKEARLAAGSVGPRPVRAPEAERLLQGGVPEAELFEEAGQLAAACVEPVDDLYGSADYKRHLVALLAREALDQAVQRAAEGDGADD